ncbi:DUF4214 domain-containing protein [Sulfitobacter sp. W074]|uniref:DUF4214 domain-containing protein n=1 Tax=Sulfitobacter sp. W074 TaxID=2867026 RepID=UPI0021A3B957|nr:DUF4214 domain-containing protein [Sulfitobacter sp. W074]UWR39437.1 DUF4214 domain-containing protein [Sulfitobacter sp. W074]
MATSAQVDALAALYAGYFNRAPDPAGLQFWIDQIDNGREFNTIAADFAGSAEATALYPYLTSPGVASPTTFITSVYQNLFNRAPDGPGLQFWSDVLASGSVSVADMIEAIINGAVDAPTATPPTFDKATLDNKIDVGRDFAADAANTTGFVFDTAAKSAAIDIMDGVTNDPATVVTAKAETDAFLSGVANPGDTFILTTGADTFVGTAGNDMFNALSVNGTGTDATTFSAFDEIDGGAGKDTLNIYSNGSGKGDENNSFPTVGTVENVEIVNIFNADAGDPGAFGDASKYMGVEQLWQVNSATAVTNLAATTTAGFRKTTAGGSVAAATGVATMAIALDEVAEFSNFNLSGDALNSITVSGTVVDAADVNTTVDVIFMNVTAGKDVQAVTLDTAVASDLWVTNTGTKAVTSVDASASTGDITYNFGPSKAVADIKTGSGDDTVLTVTATSNKAGTEVAATLDTGDGKDMITVNTSGTGTTTVNAGAGDDTVTLVSDGTGMLSVNLGEGDDAFMVGGGTVSKGDTIDGGAGSDTLQLTAVGAANITAFSNFEVFDVKALSTTLDVNILASNNTLTEIIGSGALTGASTLTNLGAGVGFRATGNMGGTPLTLTQTTGGALSLGLDIDETKEATTLATGVTANVVATNATSLAINLDADFVGKSNAAGDNETDFNATGSKATSVSITSDGDNAVNNLDYVYGVSGATAAADGVLTSATITGAQALTVDFSDGTGLITGDDETNLATVDASGMTGGLMLSLNDLKDTGTVSLGSGDDVLAAQDGAASAAAAIAEHVKLAGFEKGTAENLTSSADIDIIMLAGAVQAVDDTTGTVNASVENGLITFKNAGPTTLQQAVDQVQALIGSNEAAVFEYLGNSFIFAEGAADGAGDDVLIELTGTVGLTGLDTETATNGLYVF